MTPYAAVWRLPGAPALLVVGALARLGMSLNPLGLLLLVRDATGRFGPAALAGLGYTLGAAVGSPFAGRLADRFGRSPVLVVTAVLHPLGLVAVLLAERSLGAVVAAAAVAGVTYPPLVAVLRGAWSALTEPDGPHADLRPTALAAETAGFQMVFVLGPLLAALLVDRWSPAVVLATSAVVTSVGTGYLSAVGSVRTRGEVTHRARGLGPLRVPGFGALLGCSAGLGVAFGSASVSVPAFATTHGSPSGALGGVLLAVISGGSVLGGLGYGARPWRTPLTRQFQVLLAAIAAAFAVFGLAPNPLVLAATLLAGGSLIAPVLTVESALAGQLVPPGMRTEAFTWLLTVEVATAGVGIQASGLIADRPGGAAWAFLPGVAAVGAAAVLWWRAKARPGT